MGSSKLSFVLQTSHIHILEQLSDEQAGKLIKAVFAYEAEGAIPSFSDPLLTGFFFGCFKPFLDEAAAKYEAKCQKNRENVTKRYEGKPKVKKTASVDNGIQTYTNVNDGKQSNTFPTDMICNDMICNDIKEEEKEEEKDPAPPAGSLNIDPIIDFYNQNLGCCTAHIRDWLRDTAENFGIPNTLRACQIACERQKKSVKYIDATARGLSSTGEFTSKQDEAPKQESNFVSVSKLAMERLKEFEGEVEEF